VKQLFILLLQLTQQILWVEQKYHWSVYWM